MLSFQKKKCFRMMAAWLLILIFVTSCGWIEDDDADGFLVSDQTETEAEKVIQVRDGQAYGFLNREKQKNTWFEVDGSIPGGRDGVLKYRGFTVHTYLAPDGETEYYMGAEYTTASASVDKLETMVDVIIGQQIVPEDREEARLEKLFAYMVTGDTSGYARNTTYEEEKSDKRWPRSYALNMVQSKAGSSYAYESLYGFLAKKATGYPVRVGVGQTCGFGESLQEHAWTEIKIDGVWYVCDTNLDKYAAEGSMAYFLKRRISKAMKALYDNYEAAEYVWVRF